VVSNKRLETNEVGLESLLLKERRESILTHWKLVWSEAFLDKVQISLPESSLI